jgi:hypothetical protein
MMREKRDLLTWTEHRTKNGDLVHNFVCCGQRVFDSVYRVFQQRLQLITLVVIRQPLVGGKLKDDVLKTIEPFVNLRKVI